MYTLSRLLGTRYDSITIKSMAKITQDDSEIVSVCARAETMHYPVLRKGRAKRREVQKSQSHYVCLLRRKIGR